MCVRLAAREDAVCVADRVVLVVVLDAQASRRLLKLLVFPP